MNTQAIKLEAFSEPQVIELYTAISVAEGSSRYQVDSGTYEFTGPAVLFISPFQSFQILEGNFLPASLLQFHGDFYCIEFHKPKSLAMVCCSIIFI